MTGAPGLNKKPIQVPQNTFKKRFGHEQKSGSKISNPRKWVGPKKMSPPIATWVLFGKCLPGKPRETIQGCDPSALNMWCHWRVSLSKGCQEPLNFPMISYHFPNLYQETQRILLEIKHLGTKCFGIFKNKCHVMLVLTCQCVFFASCLVGLSLQTTTSGKKRNNFNKKGRYQL